MLWESEKERGVYRAKLYSCLIQIVTMLLIYIPYIRLAQQENIRVLKDLDSSFTSKNYFIP